MAVTKEKFSSKVEIMPCDERDRYLNKRLQEQVNYAFENSPAMKAKLKSIGLEPHHIRSVKDLEQVPITTKDDILRLQREKLPWGGFLGVPVERLERIFMSPGPIYDPQPVFEEYYDNLQTAFYSLGFRKNDLIVNTWSYHMVPAAQLFDTSLRKMGCTIIPMGTGNTNLQIQVLAELPVTGWLGTGSFLISIFKRAEELGYNIRQSFSLKTVFAGAEMGGEPIRKLLKEKYGFTALDLYALAEVGAVAYGCHQENGMHIADLIVEIVDPETGRQLGPDEIGQVVVTNFDKTYPLIRFGTGDLSSYSIGTCPCGRTSPRLSRILGRVGEAVRVRGMFIHPRQVREVISKFPEISKYQISIVRPEFSDQIIIKIELSKRVENRDQLSKEIEKAFKDNCRLRIDKFEYVGTGTIAEDVKVLIDERTFTK